MLLQTSKYRPLKHPFTLFATGFIFKKDLEKLYLGDKKDILCSFTFIDIQRDTDQNVCMTSSTTGYRESRHKFDQEKQLSF